MCQTAWVHGVFTLKALSWLLAQLRLAASAWRAANKFCQAARRRARRRQHEGGVDTRSCCGRGDHPRSLSSASAPVSCLQRLRNLRGTLPILSAVTDRGGVSVCAVRTDSPANSLRELLHEMLAWRQRMHS